MAIDAKKGLRLKRLREAKNLTQEALGAALSPPLSKQQVYKLEAGIHRITAPLAIQLGTILQAPPEDIVDEAFLISGGTEEMTAIVERGRIWAAGEAGRATVGIFDTQIAAGDGAYIDEAHRAGDITFDRAWLRSLTVASPDKLNILQLHGDSMEPTIPDGSWVMIDTTQQCIVNNGIYAFREGDEARIKKVAIHPATKQLTLISDNPLWPAASGVEPKAVKIYGRAIWYSKKL